MRRVSGRAGGGNGRQRNGMTATIAEPTDRSRRFSGRSAIGGHTIRVDPAANKDAPAARQHPAAGEGSGMTSSERSGDELSRTVSTVRTGRGDAVVASALGAALAYRALDQGGFYLDQSLNLLGLVAVALLAR